MSDIFGFKWEMKLKSLEIVWWNFAQTLLHGQNGFKENAGTLDLSTLNILSWPVFPGLTFFRRQKDDVLYRKTNIYIIPVHELMIMVNVIGWWVPRPSKPAFKEPLDFRIFSFLGIKIWWLLVQIQIYNPSVWILVAVMWSPPTLRISIKFWV